MQGIKTFFLRVVGKFRLGIDRIGDLILKPVRISVAVILIFVLLLTAGFFLYRNRINDLLALNPQYRAQAQQDETKKLVEEVGKIVQLPSETPTIATVSNVEKLQSGPAGDFFKKAKDGDKVLIFSKAQKAILYRPSEKKVLEVSSLIIPTPNP